MFEGISVDEDGRQHYLDATIAYKRAVLNCIKYLSQFGYSEEQVYLLLSCCPCEGESVLIPNLLPRPILQTVQFLLIPLAVHPLKKAVCRALWTCPTLFAHLLFRLQSSTKMSGENSMLFVLKRV